MEKHRPIIAVPFLLVAMLLLVSCDNASSPTAATTAAGSGSSSTANLQIDSGASITGAPVPALASNAPDFSLPGLDGNTYSLSAEKGKVVVIEFLATWCPHCQDDAPMMNQLNANYGGKDVQVFGINATPQGHNRSAPAAMSDLQWFSDTYKVTFPLLFDKTLKSANDYGVSFYPSIYVVDKQGKIAFVPPDDQLPTLDMLSQAIDKAENEK